MKEKEEKNAIGYERIDLESNEIKKEKVRNKKKENSMASVRKRTIPIERPPLVSEVRANFLRIEGAMVSVTNP
jgi:hypothetical protein